MQTIMKLASHTRGALQPPIVKHNTRRRRTSLYTQTVATSIRRDSSGMELVEHAQERKTHRAHRLWTHMGKPLLGKPRKPASLPGRRRPTHA